MTRPDMRRQIVLAVKGLGTITARPRTQSRVLGAMVPCRVLAAFETQPASPARERSLGRGCFAGSRGDRGRLLPIHTYGGWGYDGGRERCGRSGGYRSRFDR
jgi:hypothetical protein